MGKNNRLADQSLTNPLDGLQQEARKVRWRPKGEPTINPKAENQKNLANSPSNGSRISGQNGRAFGHTPRQVSMRALCSLPFTTKTGAKHPFIKAPAPHNTCGSCWLCVRHLTDCGLMFECHFRLLYVNSFQLVTKEKKNFSSRI